MKDNSQGKKTLALTKGIKISAIYLIVSGGLGILLPLTDLGPHYPEFQAKSFAYKFGAYARENTMNILFLISGIGILNKKIWARKIALIVLAISAIYSANNFAWGFSGGPPSSTVRVASLLIAGLWNGLWLFLIYNAKTTEMIS